MKQRISMKAIIVNGDKILLLRKAKYEGNGGNQGKWNVPGGRVEPGEHWQNALKREVLEETGINDLQIGLPISVGEWRPIISGVKTQIICLFLVCKTEQIDIKLNYEHDKFAWIKPSERLKYAILDPEGEVIDTYTRRKDIAKIE